MEQQVGAEEYLVQKPLTAMGALADAFGGMRKLLSGPGRRERWRRFTGLAAMAGIVGAGAAPPPLGLLQPVWTDPTLRQSVLGNHVIVGLALFLAVFLVLMGGFARSFTFGFLEGIVEGEPRLASFRSYLGAGTAHFVWSSLLTVPLYLLLFAGESLATHDVYQQIPRILERAGTASDAQVSGEMMAVFLLAALKFLLVLVPWTLLTLPLMVLMYELTPAAMLLQRVGPAAGCGRVLRLAGSRARLFWGYLGVRFFLQIVGNLAAVIALVPSLLAAGILSLPILGITWGLASMLGPASPGGVGVTTVGALLSAILLYCILCAALVPVSLLLNGLALRVARETSG